MLSINITQLKNDIAGKMKGTSIRQLKDFNSIAFLAANRMLARIDPEETRRTATITTPFFDNIQDYSIATDYKRMIDIRPQANRIDMEGRSHFNQTTARQFNERLDGNSFSIGYNNMIRSLRAQRLPVGNVAQLDTFDSSTSNGTWTAEGDASGLYTENLNFVQGQASLGMNLDGLTGAADIVNSTAAVADLSALRYNDTSFLYVYIPVGFSDRFTSFTLRRGSSASAYKQVTATSQIDGTVFTDGWNFLKFDWNSATTVGSPDNTQNTYRRFGMNYTVGAEIPGVLIDNWTNALGTIYEMEYYSEYLFRDATTGAWKSRPTVDTDLINVGPAAYDILVNEIMIDVTQEIRTGNVQNQELANFRMMLNGQPPNRYIKDPQYRGLYADYMNKYTSSAILTVSRNYDYDL